MTYCVGLKLNRGLVMAADTRTNAGLDNIASFRKLHTWEVRGERVFILLSAGNLAVTQAVIADLDEAMKSEHGTDIEATLGSVNSMYQAAKLVGRALKTVRKSHTDEGLSGDAFSAQFIFGGQIGKEEPRLFHIYSEGNFIEAKSDTPFFQIGEHKYGKPILDRVVTPETSLSDAKKAVLLSMDSTLRSNLSVGMPLDLTVIENDALRVTERRRIAPDDEGFQAMSRAWSQALRDAFTEISI